MNAKARDRTEVGGPLTDPAASCGAEFAHHGERRVAEVGAPPRSRIFANHRLRTGRIGFRGGGRAKKDVAELVSLKFSEIFPQTFGAFASRAHQMPSKRRTEASTLFASVVVAAT